MKSIQNDFIYRNCVNINMKMLCYINNITSDWNISLKYILNI